jgi:hypothetical protein
MEYLFYREVMVTCQKKNCKRQNFIRNSEKLIKAINEGNANLKIRIVPVTCFIKNGKYNLFNK